MLTNSQILLQESLRQAAVVVLKRAHKGKFVAGCKLKFILQNRVGFESIFTVFFFLLLNEPIKEFEAAKGAF